jgi:hypothetical protein
MIEYITKTSVFKNGTFSIFMGHFSFLELFLKNGGLSNGIMEIVQNQKSTHFCKKLHTEKLGIRDRVKKEEFDGTGYSKKMSVWLWGREGIEIFETLSEVSLFYHFHF